MEPTPDPRIEAARKWTPKARLAAREAFSATVEAGADRETAVEAGHKAGLRVELEERALRPSEVELVMKAASLFGIAAPTIVEAEAKPPARPSRSFKRGKDEAPSGPTKAGEAAQARPIGQRIGKP
jgi:hypothetical protein